jgi:hypothetical protein
MKKYLLSLAIITACALTATAHTIQYELDKMTASTVFYNYIFIGFQHIIPSGTDHILFIICVFFLNKNLKQIILQASMFTLAHSITLALAMYGIIHPTAAIIEPLIAFSIVLLAIENIFTDKVKPWRIIMVFLFGLIHGLGFAGSLAQLGLPNYAFANALISFNIGVELGQLTIIFTMYWLIAKLFAHKTWYKERIVIPASTSIAIIAAYWTVERVFF